MVPTLVLDTTSWVVPTMVPGTTQLMVPDTRQGPYHAWYYQIQWQLVPTWVPWYCLAPGTTNILEPSYSFAVSLRVLRKMGTPPKKKHSKNTQTNIFKTYNSREHFELTSPFTCFSSFFFYKGGEVSSPLLCPLLIKKTMAAGDGLTCDGWRRSTTKKT